MFKKWFGKKKSDKVEDVNILSNDNNSDEVVEKIGEVTTADEVIESDEVIAVDEMIEDNIVTAIDEMIDVVEVKKEEKPKKMGFFKKLINGLSKTRSGFTDKLDRLFNSYGKIDEDLYEELEEILIMSDIGMETTMDIMDKLRELINERKIKDPTKIKKVLHEVLLEFLASEDESKLNIDENPQVILVIGVNGAGKTTSIGKISSLLKAEGHSVLLSAADTFRAAASDQLKVWASRVGVDIISQGEGADPAAVVFDSIQAAKARSANVLICDTAGRLHNKKNLMNELEKISRVINREYPQANKEVLLVLDATTGQNAVQQAKLFKEVANITGIILTKLDGTAKGGAVLAIHHTLGIPVKFIGVGESVDDLQRFNPKEFVSALLGEES